MGLPLSPSILIKLQETKTSEPFSFSQEMVSQFEEAYIESNQRLAAAFPGEFDNFAAPDWTPHGKDSTGILTNSYLAGLLASYLKHAETNTEKLATLQLLREHEQRVSEYELNSPRFLARHLVHATANRIRAILRSRFGGAKG